MVLLALACALASAPSGRRCPWGAWAQSVDPVAVLKPPAESETALITGKAVDILCRDALIRLRSVANPTKEHLRAAALALRIIRRLAPDDPDLLRLEIEAWTSAGDDDEALAATRQLLRLDPTDQIAQLRVAVAGLDRLQDVDSRLRAYDRILGSEGSAVDPAVRSRLALDASLLARDNGDQKGFLKYLTRAMTLDPSNKDAAALFGSYVLGRSDDAMRRVEVLCNIILADPLDGQAYENLALELLSHGAYAGALRAYGLGTQIAVARGWVMTPERVFDFALCEWRVKGPVPALARIKKVVDDSLLAEKQRRDAAIAQGLDPGPERPMYLPPNLNLMRLAIAVSQRSVEGAKTVLDEYLTADELQVENIKSHPGKTPQEQRRINVTLEAIKLQHLWAMLFAGQRVDEAQKLFDELLAENARKAGVSGGSGTGAEGEAPTPEADAGDDAKPAAPVADQDAKQASAPSDASDDASVDVNPPPLEPEVIQRFRGWLAMLHGEDLEAERLLAPLVDKDPNARWAMAVLREQQGNDREAMLNFALLAKENPRSALSTAAWDRLIDLHGGPVAPSEEAQALDQYVVNFAPWLNNLASDASSFMSLLVRHEADVVDPLGEIKVDVTVRNVSGWPLAVGADRPIPKRLLLAPRLRLKGQDASNLATPSVVLIPNRLRLAPSEEVTVVVTPTRGPLGSLLDLTPGAIASLRWQAVQGFVKGPEQGYQAGSMTVTTLSDVVVRPNLDDSIGTNELASQIGVLDGADLLRTILIARRQVADEIQSNKDLDGARTLMHAILARFPSMGPLEQTIVLGWLGEAGIGVKDEFTPSVRSSVGDPTTYPALALLMGFVSDPEDPLLQSMVASDDDDLSRLGFIWRELLRKKAMEPAPAKATNGAKDGAASPPASSTP